jgi:large subunit ribosomal protein L19
MINKAISRVEQDNLRQDKLTDFTAGDLVHVHVKIREGDKERVQIFKGTVIARSGRGVNESFTVRRVSHGVGVERVFPLNSPRIADLKVERSSHVRRAKLYYLRNLVGKKARLREKIV